METVVQETYYPSGKLKTQTEAVDGKNHGKNLLFSENGQILVETFFEKGKCHGKWTEYYENGQLAEEGNYIFDVYHVINFWTENGEQLLTNGTGKVLRKYGFLQADIYEQYFENGEFTGEKKIAGLKIIGKFIED